MLLAIDIGNSTTVFGIFEGEKLVRKWSEDTHNLRLPPSLCELRRARKSRLTANLPALPCLAGRQAAGRFAGSNFQVIVSSVVPKADKIIKKKFPQAHFVTASNIKGIKVKARKSEVGADRVVNALAAYKLYGAPAIVVDFGTATTFDVISAQGEYLGGAIAPGIGLSAKILHQATAKLPEVTIKAPKNIIGKNTKDAILSGLVYGYVSLIEGMIQRIKSKLQTSCLPAGTAKSKIQIIATGGFAGLIAKYTDIIDVVDQEIILKGLKLSWEAANDRRN